jgi:hypothetical protein
MPAHVDPATPREEVAESRGILRIGIAVPEQEVSTPGAFPKRPEIRYIHDGR